MNTTAQNLNTLKEKWDQLLALDSRVAGKRACGRIINPLVVVVYLLCGALTISPITWLNGLCTDAEALANTTGWVRIVADKWMGLGLYDHYFQLSVVLAAVVMLLPLAVGLLAKLLLLPMYQAAGKRSTEELTGDELHYLQRLKEMSASVSHRMRCDLRDVSWAMAWIGSIVLGGLFAVAMTTYEFISSGYQLRGLLTGLLVGVVAGALLACVYLILFMPAWYLGTVNAARGVREPVESIRNETEKQLNRLHKELEQAERERKASETARRKQEKEIRIQRILKEADSLFVQQKYAEAMKAYQPLAEELVPQGRAGYLLSRVGAVRMPDLKDCRPMAEELRKLERMELPAAVKKACHEVADALTEMIRTQCTQRFFRAQELINLGMDTSALPTLKEISELGMPEAVPVYVSAAVKLEASKEQYPEFIRLLDMANQLGFSVEAAKNAYRLMQPKLNYDYGRHLVGRGKKSDGESYIRVAANMGSAEASRYLNPPVVNQVPQYGTSGTLAAEPTGGLTSRDQDEPDDLQKEPEKAMTAESPDVSEM